jgi:hypothetical protein
MAQGDILRVRGYREFQRACARGPKDTRAETRKALNKVGDVLRTEWSGRLFFLDPKTAAGLRTRVTTRGISVQQRLGKTTGKRPDFGRTQMRYGLAALAERQRDIEHAFEDAIDEIADNFERR